MLLTGNFITALKKQKILQRPKQDAKECKKCAQEQRKICKSIGTTEKTQKLFLHFYK